MRLFTYLIHIQLVSLPSQRWRAALGIFLMCGLDVRP
jgi:hypothetical protein